MNPWQCRKYLKEQANFKKPNSVRRCLPIFLLDRASGDIDIKLLMLHALPKRKFARVGFLEYLSLQNNDYGTVAPLAKAGFWYAV